MSIKTSKRKPSTPKSDDKKPQDESDFVFDDLFSEIMSDQKQHQSRKDDLQLFDAKIQQAQEKSKAQYDNLKQIQESTISMSESNSSKTQLPAQIYKSLFEKPARMDNLTLYQVQDPHPPNPREPSPSLAKLSTLFSDPSNLSQHSHQFVTAIEHIRSDSDWNQWRENPPSELVQALFRVSVCSRNIYAVDEAMITLKALWSGVNESRYNSIVSHINFEPHLVSQPNPSCWKPSAGDFVHAFQYFGAKYTDLSGDLRPTKKLKYEEDATDYSAKSHVWFVPNLRAVLELFSFLLTNWPSFFTRSEEFPKMIEYSLRMCLDPLWTQFSFQAKKFLSTLISLKECNSQILEDLICGGRISFSLEHKISVLLKLSKDTLVRDASRRIIKEFCKKKAKLPEAEFCYTREWTLDDISKLIAVLHSGESVVEREDQIRLVKLSHLSCGPISSLDSERQAYLSLYKSWRDFKSTMEMFSPNYSQDLDDVLDLVLISHNSLSHLHSMKGLFELL